MSAHHHRRAAELADELDTIGERLTDLSMDVLREAVDRGEGRRPDLDRTLAGARRAVEKAVRTLRSAAADEEEDGSAAF